MKKLLLLFLLILLPLSASAKTEPSWYDLKDIPAATILAPTDGTDAAPKIRAALASGGAMILPTGDYTFSSVDTSHTISITADTALWCMPGANITATASNTYVLRFEVASDTSLFIDGLKIDGGNKCSQGIRVNQVTGGTGGIVAITTSSVENIFVPVTPPGSEGAVGIRVNGYFDRVDIEKNKIHSIVVDPNIAYTYLMGTISAVGINANFYNSGILNIKDNDIDYINCHAASGTANVQVQADAIYTTSATTFSTAKIQADISGNRISRSEGRSWKNQTPFAKFHHNKIIIGGTFPTGSFVMLDDQTATANMSDNDIEIAASADFNGVSPGGILTQVLDNYSPEAPEWVSERNNVSSFNAHEVSYFHSVGATTNVGERGICKVDDNSYSLATTTAGGLAYFFQYNLGTATETGSLRATISNNRPALRDYGFLYFYSGEAFNASGTAISAARISLFNNVNIGPTVNGRLIGVASFAVSPYPGSFDIRDNYNFTGINGVFRPGHSLKAPTSAFFANSNAVATSSVGFEGLDIPTASNAKSLVIEVTGTQTLGNARIYDTRTSVGSPTVRLFQFYLDNIWE